MSNIAYIKDIILNTSLLTDWFSIVAKIVSINFMSKDTGFFVMTIGDVTGTIKMIVFFNDSFEYLKEMIVIGKNYFFNKINLTVENNMVILVYNSFKSSIIKYDRDIDVDMSNDYSAISVNLIN